MSINEALNEMTSLFSILMLDGALSDEEIKTMNEVERTIYNFVEKGE